MFCLVHIPTAILPTSMCSQNLRCSCFKSPFAMTSAHRMKPLVRDVDSLFKSLIKRHQNDQVAQDHWISQWAHSVMRLFHQHIFMISSCTRSLNFPVRTWYLSFCASFVSSWFSMVLCAISCINKNTTENRSIKRCYKDAPFNLSFFMM